MTVNRQAEGSYMNGIDAVLDVPQREWIGTRRTPACRPGPVRPAGAPVRYRGTGVRMSRARGPQRRRAITPATTVGLALLAALITLWLGVVAQFGHAVSGPATTAIPDRLAVVQVQSGETLAHVAERVAPGAPVGPVVERIRELNKIDGAALDAGQTLIAPIG